MGNAATEEKGVGGGVMGAAGREEETRKGAALNKQISLFIEMSTPFFKVLHGIEFVSCLNYI